MANLIGNGISQIPTNGMLGNLAFQDKAYVSVDKVGIGTTFVDSGTTNQILQVYGGGAYVSGNVGIGSTNPTTKLYVVGDGYFTGVVTANSFVGSGSSLTGLIPNAITDISANTIYYPLLSPVTSGTISSISVASTSLVFNPGLNFLGIGTTNPVTALQVGYGSSVVVIDARGAIGIGTTNPTSRYHLSGIGTTSLTGDNNRIRIGDFHWDDVYTTIHAKKVRSEWWLEQNSEDSDGVDLIFYKSRGIPNQEKPVQLGDNVARITTRVYQPSRTGIGTTITLADWSGDAAGQIEFNVDNVTATEAFCSIDFKTKSTSRLLISSVGNVGIGTTNPQTKFDVSGLGQFTANGATLNLVGTDHSYIQWYPDGISSGRKAYTGFPGTNANYFEISNEISDGSGHIYLNPGTNATVLIDTFTPTGTASQPLQVNGGAYVSGSVGIGITNPTSKLHVEGGVRVVGIVTATVFESSSDFNLKTDISIIENPIEKVMKIDGVSFKWRSTNKPSLGVIAQNIEKILPELVSGNETKSVNYNGLIGLLIETVKDLSLRLDKVSLRIEELEDRMR